MEGDATQVEKGIGGVMLELDGEPRVLAIAQVEERNNLDKQIIKQTVQPEKVIYLEDGSPASGINARRVRIAENHKKLQDIVDAYKPDLVWQLEGDCLLPENTLETLIKRYQELKSDRFGYVSAIQVGRHGIYAIGAWHIGDDWFESVDKNLKGIQEVDATGFYCLLAPYEVWREGVAVWNGEPWGPDVNWGLSLRSKGYIIVVDMDLPIGHKTGRGEIWPHYATTTNVRFKKKNDKWEYKTRD